MDYSPTKGFEAIDEDGIGSLNMNNIKLFMKKLKVIMPKGALVGVIRRFDMDGDGKI